ncbi:endonuclease/exonuclease/phosphatase family protein [Aggregatilinea lenta]|uniref:endonuclease/exonuclease/phosphatase family protein n=1 Tax=Aggregatilinea lenta TaxID=913108 RepID=UPI000E5C4358|nr:endonuclease/exonuclease/phosphatase family protein [Aggregatilinea lenta]
MWPWLRALRRIGVLALILCGSFVNAFLVGVILAPYRAPFIALNQASHWITLLSVLLFAIAVFLKSSTRLLVWLGPGVIAFVIWYLPAWRPRSSPDVSGTPIIAATYNVNMWGSAKPEEIISVISAVEADVVGLQELSPALQARLELELRDHYPYQVSEAVEGYEGFALLSRFPIMESNVIMDVDWYPVDRRVPGYLRAVLNMNPQYIAVYVIHTPLPIHYIDSYSLAGYLQGLRYALFEYDDGLQLAHMAHIADLVAAETIPVLVLCDCNSTPHSRQYEVLDKVMDDAYDAQGWGLGLSHPVKPFRMLRLDYIWYSSEFSVVDATVWSESGTSDHYPIRTRLALDMPRANLVTPYGDGRIE